VSHLSIDDFPAFFAAVNDGRRPFAWQRRLADHVLSMGRWPEVIDAPTGSGKSSVIDIHVFAQAAATVGATPRPPRRLVLTVDRRALVDGHFRRALHLQETLAKEWPPGDPCHVIADALRSLRHASDPDRVDPLVIAKLRGGEAPDRLWIDAPTACQVIAATPDMVGSRLLFGGYGSADAAKPREAGLLAFDSVFVVDEAHLNRQLLATLRRVGELTAPDSGRIGIPAVQAVAMTATQAPSGGISIGVTPDDLDGSEVVLRDRLTRPKPVSVVESEHWGSRSVATAKLADQIASLTIDALAENGGTVGCIVNTVALAVEVARRVRETPLPEHTSLARASLARAGAKPSVVTLVGRLRKRDLADLTRQHPGLLTLEGDPDVDVVVATQTIEVGVDMDLSALVTQLSPGAAIAQRAGRVNRSGTRTGSPVVVIAPGPGTEPERTAAPYEAADLVAGATWLRRLEATTDGLAPWAIHPSGGGDIPPSANPRRPVWQRVEPWDVREWSRTSDDVPVRPALDLWLSDSLEQDHSASIVVRRGLPADPQSAVEQLHVTPPLDDETFPVSIPELRRILGEGDDRRRTPPPRAFVVRDPEVHSLRGPEVSGWRVRPGDVVVLDESVAAFQEGVATSASGATTARDVGESDLTRSGPRSHRWVRVGMATPTTTDADGRVLPGVDELLRDLRRLTTSGPGDQSDVPVSRQVGIRIRAWLESLTGGSTDGPPRHLLRRFVDDVISDDTDGRRRPEVTWPTATDSDEEGQQDFWVAIQGTEAAADDETRQFWIPSRAAVDLSVHEAAVAEACRDIAERLGLVDSAAQALTLAGLWHDEGKSDRRFQRSLRARDADHPGRTLAKSGNHSLQTARRARASSGLPSGWRHEELSAALAWDKGEDLDPVVRDLVTRLAGTSHGRGRHEFPHTAVGLALEDPVESATLLFDEAEWERLLDRTEQQWGLWGCAYLEALLRAADVTVSRRGS